MTGKIYYVYILTNKQNRVLYVGITSNLERRLYEHKNHLTPGFASKYRCNKLVLCEPYYHPEEAIQREKQLKNGSRARKVALIECDNPHWLDLAAEW